VSAQVVMAIRGCYVTTKLFFSPWFSPSVHVLVSLLLLVVREKLLSLSAFDFLSRLHSFMWFNYCCVRCISWTDTSLVSAFFLYVVFSINTIKDSKARCKSLDSSTWIPISMGFSIYTCSLSDSLFHAQNGLLYPFHSLHALKPVEAIELKLISQLWIRFKNNNIVSFIVGRNSHQAIHWFLEIWF